jgi:transposase
MELLHVERLDHFGLLVSVIKNLRLIERIDARLVPDAQEEITPGEAMAGMILNGLGFTHRPLSLTPQFFANTPLDLLFREGVHAERFNRFQLGRTLDEAYDDGGDLLLSALALGVCDQEGSDRRCNHLDTTRFSLSGADVPDSAEQAIPITHGYSKDHRPDLKQAVLALLVSQDGGVPLVSKSWDGNASDTQIFQERAEAVLATFTNAPTPRYVVADAKLSNEDNATHLTHLGCITRIPGTRKLVSHVISQALRGDAWQELDATTRYQRLELGPYGMAQRWWVVASQAACERAESTVTKACQRASEAIAKQLFHWHAKRFETPEAAHAALAALEQSWRSHQVETANLIEHKRYADKGRPTSTTPMQATGWQMHAQVRPDHEQMRHRIQHHACCVLGTNIAASPLNDPEIIAAYKAQAQVEGGLRFLKDPLCFVSSLLVKKPSRIQGLLLVMTLALLVYSVTQRRLRQQLARQGETVPNQINQPTAWPTLRWVFQLLEGIHRVRVTVQGQWHDLIEGLHEVQINILRLFGEEVCRLYQISPG